MAKWKTDTAVIYCSKCGEPVAMNGINSDCPSEKGKFTKAVNRWEKQGFSVVHGLDLDLIRFNGCKCKEN
jgi:hypothetical protein